MNYYIIVGNSNLVDALVFNKVRFSMNELISKQQQTFFWCDVWRGSNKDFSLINLIQNPFKFKSNKKFLSNDIVSMQISRKPLTLEENQIGKKPIATSLQKICERLLYFFLL